MFPFSTKISHKFMAASLVANVVVLLIFFFSAYTLSRKKLQTRTFQAIQAIGLTLRPRIDGDAHERLARGCKTLRSTKACGALFQQQVEPLRQAHRSNRLKTDLYTLRITESLRAQIRKAPNRVVKKGTQFILMSGPKPYYRHAYLYKPEMRDAFFHKKVVWVPPYIDKHGHWLSVYVPILSSKGKVTGILEIDRRMDQLYLENRHDLEGLLLLLIALSLLSTLLIYLVSRSISAPVKQLALAAERFGEGDYNSKIEISSQDEIGRLAKILEFARAERKRVEQQLMHDALHDGLTGLPNRNLLLERIARSLTRFASRKQEGSSAKHLFAVLFFDLDRFKKINESLGHSIGDRLLCAFAQRLETLLSEADTIARLGGDEFVVLLEGLKRSEDAARFAEQVQEALASEPFVLDEHRIFTTASIGIALSKPDYKDPEALLRDAHNAMYRAKEAGKARHEIFDKAMHESALSSLRLEHELRQALQREEFVPYYQPLIALETGVISSFEVLVRWMHPERGLIPPGQFIPLAEETGLIVDIDWWVLRQACAQARLWQERFEICKTLNINVNLSARQFAEPDLLERIEEILAACGLSPDFLRLEITESLLMDDVQSAQALLERIRSLQVQLHLDDFGTGFSSLSYLHRFPVNALKIDRSFISHRGQGPEAGVENAGIVDAIVNLAGSLDLKVTAEGIETAQQLQELRDIGCDYGQGFFLAKPLPADEAEKLLEQKPSW